MKIPLKNIFANSIFAGNFARLLTVSLLIVSSSVFANPSVPLLPNVLPAGAKVVAGTVAISSSQTMNSATMNVNQTSQRAIINWDSFNVGKNVQVNFNQPNANAVTLNRVNSATPSMIEGSIRANGQVVFVNPNGITFGKGADINAAGVVATTMDIANKDFMGGKSTFKGNGSGAVINQGKIEANVEHGYIALLAPEVRNEGYLLAIKGVGAVAMASGEQITLDFKGNSLISLKVDVSTYKGLIENKRVVEVDGGLVVLAAGAANQLMGSVIKNTGRIAANSLVNNGGVIELVANTVTQAGKVSANSQSKEGGQVNIVGNDITLATSSQTIATGAQGGGQVNVGLASTQVTGGTQVNTQNPSLPSNLQAEAAIKANAQAASSAKQMAKKVTIQENALIDTSATQAGNGGTIAIWSEVKTTAAGILKSMGGSQSGNGGFIETSSKGHVSLAPTVSINTAGNNKTGKSGTWLLDPIDLTIDSGAANVISAALANNNVTIEVNANTASCPIGSCTQNGSGSLTIASGADILKSGTNLTTLTLSASGIFNLDVIIRSSIAYLNVGSTIAASKVTVQAQSIYSAGIIQTNRYLSNANPGSLGNAMELLGQAIYISGRLSASPLANSGVAGSIKLTANTITLQAGAILQANGDEGGVITLAANDALWSSPTIQANGGNGRGGTLSVTAANDLHFNQALLQANGTTDGGTITLIANQGDLIIQNALIQTNGSTGRGGSIGASASNEVSTDSSTFEASGYTHGGQILIGNDAQHGTLPFALVANLDQYTSFNTAQLDPNPANQQGGFIETSGQTLNMLSSINAGRGGMWLLDPTNVTINATAGTSTGTDPLSFTNQTNISAAQIQTAINSGISVQIIADGTITQSANLSFSIASGSSASLTLDNSSGTAQAITLTGTTTNTGSGDLNLNYFSNGQIKINGAINATSAGKINLVAQTSYATNTLTSCSLGACASIVNGASGSINTKGGYVVMDTTGGAISGTTITPGSILNGPVYLNADINTTTGGGASSGAGGHYSVAASANQASGIGSFEPHAAALNIGGDVNIQL
ncbi:filamentous hemagglutinin N-terminal domain-containing protein [Polynucleobacter necessarius]|uniref:two-partner secretion domain-containing protein n=1 Tax=Polynucleobacter necessarius TaxID=576610 RepID=UPI000E08D87E|nr:filamentous hemagglutinin N-terminal domain-containing protein [Polynucleobacter necessarius]